MIGEYPMSNTSNKIKALRDYSSVIIANTKAVMEGKSENANRETRALTNLLKELLGREATAEELATSQKV